MKVPEQFRILTGIMASDINCGNNGAFLIPFESYVLHVVASDQQGWEHVSVSLKNRCPNWKEMCYIKDLFWDAEEPAIQFHPPKSQYVNVMPFCLHLWSRAEGFELPPHELI